MEGKEIVREWFGLEKPRPGDRGAAVGGVMPYLHLQVAKETIAALTAERDALSKDLDIQIQRTEDARAALDAEREAILAALYPKCYVEVARLCDEELDRSGALLGRVRERVEHARSRHD